MIKLNYYVITLINVQKEKSLKSKQHKICIQRNKEKMKAESNKKGKTK